MAGEYTLTGLAVPAGLDDLHDLLERIGTEHPQLSAADLMLFETAVIEIAGNVVEHGRPPGEVHWTFTLAVLEDRIEATLSDDGVPFEGGDALPDAEMPDALAEGGRGFALAGAVLDELDYRRTDGANHWQLVRNRT
ncbi:MAG: ATP-binding protein [Nocardioides sp.]